jgi:hypothetical protein
MTLSKHQLTFLCCLAIAEASSNGGNFMVMSEVTVPLNEKGEQIHSDTRNTPDVNGDGVDDRTESSSILNDNDSNNAGSADQSSGGGGSDTDGEEDDEEETPDNIVQPQSVAQAQATAATDASVSQPLRTLKRLQAMLDDSDYATSAVTPASAIESHNLDQDALYSNKMQSTPPEPDKLWTRQDRAKYRRTRRAERQRHDYEQQRAQQFREMERQHIVRAERERKELEDLRRKQLEVLELQRREAAKREAMQRQFMEYSDEETDTDGMGFELPNLPVYLSDGETEEFEEEGSEEKFQGRNRPSVPSYLHRRGASVKTRDFRGQNSAVPSFSYAPPRNSEYDSYHRAQQRHTPPTQRQTPQFDYRQPSPPQQQQQQTYSTNYVQQQGASPQYQYTPNQQQINEQQQQQQPQQAQQYQFNPNQEQQQQYEHQYTAWAQAAANGYYYPPPIPHQQQHVHPNQQHQNQQFTPPYRPPYPPNQPNEGFVHPPPYGQSYPSFVPQQRATLPETQAGAPVNQHPGNQGFFSRDNHVTQEWLQQQSTLATQHDPNLNFTPAGDGTMPMAMDVELQNSSTATVMERATAMRQDVMSPLIPTDSATIIAPINAEGPYCELKDESVSVKTDSSVLH